MKQSWYHPTSAKIKSEIIFTDFADSKRISIKIIQGDITQDQATAIVNAANGELWYGGGVAGAIRRAGGSQIERESDAIIKQRGGKPIPTGEVCLTSAGNLMSKFVIHAVGPIWRGGQKGEETLLRMCVKNILELGNQRGFKEIAIPAVSSGIFGFPNHLCAKIFFDVIERFFTDSSQPKIEEIRLINIDFTTVQVFITEFDRRYVAEIKQATAYQIPQKTFSSHLNTDRNSGTLKGPPSQNGLLVQETNGGTENAGLEESKCLNKEQKKEEELPGKPQIQKVLTGSQINKLKKIIRKFKVWKSKKEQETTTKRCKTKQTMV